MAMTTHQIAYDETRKWFAILPALAFPVTLVINAPFGRFSTQKEGLLTVDGIKSWIFMELVAPLTFAYTYYHSPLAPYGPVHPDLTQLTPNNVLALAFIAHYMNRALVSPLRTPSRAKSHLIIPLCASVWNLANGYLIGSYLSSPAAVSYLSSSFGRTRFWVGLGVWAAGFAGNIIHDEILLNLRRKVKKPNNATSDGNDNNNGKSKKEHYAIPHGLLFEWVTFPNYFCEWVEWIGFALAASPTPSLTDFGTFTPPWLFVVAEVLVMFPRAWKGHQWYHKTFPDYPKDRRVVLPYVL